MDRHPPGVVLSACQDVALQQECVGGTASPHTLGDAGGRLDPSRAGQKPEKLGILLPHSAAPALPAPAWGPAAQVSNSPARLTAPGNFTSCPQGHPLLPTLCSLPGPFLFQEGSNNPLAICRAGLGAAVGERAGGCQAKRTTWLWVTHGALLDSGSWWRTRSKDPVPRCYPKAGRKRTDEAGGSSLLGTSHQD